MATIIEHGKYWQEETQQAYRNVRVQCPECGEPLLVSSYYIYEVHDTPAVCECGCKFIPDVYDVLQEI